MGFLSKLFGNKSEVRESVNNASGYVKQENNIPKGPSGFSWGPVMPDEENQYNYNGTYKEYFDDVFRSEFSGYMIESVDANGGRATVFTFWEGGKKALVVELISRKSSVYKLRSDCKAMGIPYLRFYHDYHGWWNTREYVKQRTHNALMGQ